MTTTKYDWIKFFRSVAEKLYEISKNADTRDSEMVELAKKVFGKKHPIVQYSKNGIDPFSFVYSLSPEHAHDLRKQCAKIFLENESLSIITDEEYPHPIHRHLFHQFGRRCQTKNGKLENNAPKTEREALDQLWKLFHDCYNAKKYYDIGDGRIRQTIQGICGVGLVNLTHTFFLINPQVFLPIDNRTLHLSANKDIRSMSEKEIRKQIEKDKWQFSGVMDSLLKQFPGCLPYEFNLFGYLIKKEKLKIRQKYWMISSQATGDKEGDFWDKKTLNDSSRKEKTFRENNCVWVGAPKNPDNPSQSYHDIKKAKPGDIIFCRSGHQKAYGIGIVNDNSYSNGWKGDAYISVIWIAATKQEVNITEQGTSQPKAFRDGKNYYGIYETAYPETFELLERLLKIKNMKQDQKNLILTGPPGTGKTRLAKQLAAWLCIKGNEVDGSPLLHWLHGNVADKEWEEMIGKFKDPAYKGQMELVQFHPSYNYEDFVRGIVAETTDKGQITYEVQNKILAKLAEDASKDLGNPYVLIIDEINRANLSSVLGELIYALEYRGEPVQALYPIPEDPEQNDEQPKGDEVPTQEEPEQDEGQPKGNPETDEPEQDDHTLIIPHNLYIIGTMNTADRSVGVIDYAIRRRFIFRKVASEREIVEKNNSSAINLYDEIIKLFGDHLSSEFNQEDMMIGHSYFIPRDVEKTTDLGLRLEYEIKPLLEEYVRDGILLEEYAGDDNLTDEDRKTKKASEKIKELKIS